MNKGTRTDRNLLSYYREMNYYLFLNSEKIKLFPNNNSVKYPNCPGRPGVKKRRAKNKIASRSRKANFKKG